jgi:hypothetical protein
MRRFSGIRIRLFRSIVSPTTSRNVNWRAKLLKSSRNTRWEGTQVDGDHIKRMEGMEELGVFESVWISIHGMFNPGRYDVTGTSSLPWAASCLYLEHRRWWAWIDKVERPVLDREGNTKHQAVCWRPTTCGNDQSLQRCLQIAFSKPKVSNLKIDT